MDTKTDLNREYVGVVPLTTWLQAQNQNARVVTEDGQAPIFTRTREGDIVIKNRPPLPKKPRARGELNLK